jgi:cyclophilin family peptidyl-prolyl cis-trans isomerase
MKRLFIVANTGKPMVAQALEAVRHRLSGKVQLTGVDTNTHADLSRVEADLILILGGDGNGSPGFMIDAEFSARPHETGVLSMARNTDPGEGPGVMPRPEFANSAGSQFFICLSSDKTRQLDGKYTVFAKVVGGMDAVNRIAAAPHADEKSERPKEPQVIRKIEVKPVVPGENPYVQILRARDVTAEVVVPARQAAAKQEAGR